MMTTTTIVHAIGMVEIVAVLRTITSFVPFVIARTQILKVQPRQQRQNPGSRNKTAFQNAPAPVL